MLPLTDAAAKIDSSIAIKNQFQRLEGVGKPSVSHHECVDIVANKSTAMICASLQVQLLWKLTANENVFPSYEF